MLPLPSPRFDIPNQSRPVRHDRYHRSDIHRRVLERVERVWLDRQRRGLDVVFRRVSFGFGFVSWWEVLSPPRRFLMYVVEEGAPGTHHRSACVCKYAPVEILTLNVLHPSQQQNNNNNNRDET